MLNVIFQAAEEFLASIKLQTPTAKTRLQLAGNYFQKKDFFRKDYLAFYKNISTATASRDLLTGVKQKILHKSGARALTRYRFTA
jgi:Fic family protein